MDDVLRKQLISSLIKNKRQVALTVNHLNSFHVASVRKGTKVNELDLDNIFAKVILPLWVSLFEIELDQVLFRYPMFDDLRTETGFNRQAEYVKWKKVIEKAFRMQYGLSMKSQITATTIGDTTYHRYKSMCKALDDLDAYIQLRNRIAHGQWAIAFNESGDSKNEQLTQKAWTLSKKDMMIVKVYYKNLPRLLNELCSSRSQFENNYDKHMKKLNLVGSEIDNRFRLLKSKTPEIILKRTGYKI